MPNNSYTLQITRKENLPGGVVYFALENTQFDENGVLKDLPTYSAGSHIQLTLSSGTRRNYSLLGDGSDLKTYEIAVKRLESGRGGSKELIDQYQIGDSIEVQEPHNLFPLVRAPRYLFIAGGIGITPMIAFMKSLLKHENYSFQLIYCSRFAEETPFKDWIEQHIPNELVTFHYDQGDLGQIFDFWPLVGEPTDQVVYCCGPKSMMEDVKAMTGHWDEGAIHFEDFGSSGNGNDQTISNQQNISFEVERFSTKQIYRIEEHQTILEGLRQHGFQLASSCESGTCGTCKTTYLAGNVDHRDFVLTSEEQKNQLMICVSRGCSTTLVLDF